MRNVNRHKLLFLVSQLMSQNRKTNTELSDDNKHLRAQVAQLEDRLDHLSEHGTAAVALQQAEALHREVMGAVSDVVLVADEAGRLKYVSPNAHLIFGYSAADILKQGRVAFVLPGEFFDPDVLEQRREIPNIERQIRDAVGRSRNLLITVRRIESLEGALMFVCRDATERIKIELDYELLSLTLERRVDEQTRELRENRDRYRRLVEGLRDEYMFYATDPEGIITYVSPSIYNILGYRPDQAIGTNWREFVDNSTSEYAELENMERMRFAGLPTPPFSAWVLHANGTNRLFEFRDSSLKDADGRVIANEGIGKDITERHEAELALRQAREELQRGIQEATAELTQKNMELQKSKEIYRSIIQDHLEFIIRWRDDGVLTFVNDSYCRYWDAKPKELEDVTFMSTVLEEDKDLLREKLATLSFDRPVVEHDHRVVRPDGRTSWVHWTHRALFNEQKELIEYQSVGCDSTDRRQQAEHLRAQVDAAAQLRDLTDREHDVMRLVVAGDPNKVMARKLGLSIKTIEKHRGSLMKKLHVRSVPELVRLAMLVDDSAPT
jgi:PAS domain S-box-containing protein